MPVKLEHIRTPEAADWQDLEKIHLDTAADGFTKNPEQLQQWLKDGGWIVAGRFNDRLIGAFLAREVAPNVVELSCAGVRTVTQRRGVLHQMIHFISKWSREEGKTLQVSECPPDFGRALEHREFVRNNTLWTYNPLR